MLYFWKLASGDLADAKQIVAKLRQKAVELRWEPVGEVIHLNDQCLNDERLDKKFLLIGAGDDCLVPHEVVFFTAKPPGDVPRPLGLAAFPGHIEGDRQVVPSHLGEWCWVGVIRSHEREACRNLMQTAADLGLEVTAS